MTYSGTGFAPAQPKAVPEVAAAVVVEESINIRDLVIDTVPLCETGNMLPIGVKLPDEVARTVGLGVISAATKTEIDALIADALKDRNNDFGALAALPGCLNKAVDTVGDRSTELLMGQFFANSASRLFDAFYVNDLVFLCFAIRLKKMKELQSQLKQQEIQFKPFDFVMKVQCADQGCTKTFESVVDFSDMDVGFVQNLPASHRIEVTLPAPFRLYEDTPQEELITYLHFSPTPTLRSLKKVMDLQAAMEMKDAKHRMSPTAMSVLSYIMDIPESPSLSSGRHWSLRLWHHMTENPTNLNCLLKALEKLDKIGPQVQIPLVCPCNRKFAWKGTVPWIDLANFWYNAALGDSDEL